MSRRFYVWRQQDQTGVSGTGVVAEGVVFDDGTCVMRWHSDNPTTDIHDNLESVMKIHGHPGTSLLWCDHSQNAPKPCQVYRGVSNKSEPGFTTPSTCLMDGWGEKNGAVDHKGTPLWTGQRVRLVRWHGEVSNVGEIINISTQKGKLMVGLYGTDCGPAAYPIEEIEAIETSIKQTHERNGGTKPSFGWSPALTINVDPSKQKTTT